MIDLLSKLLKGDPNDPTVLFKILRNPSSHIRAHVYKEIRENIKEFYPFLHLIDLYVLKSITMAQCDELDQVMMLIQEWIQYDLPYSILYVILAYSREKEYISKVCVGLVMECTIHHPQLKIAHHFINNLNLDWRISDISTYILISLMENKESRHSFGMLSFLSPLIDQETQEIDANYENIINFIFLLINTWQGIFYLKQNASVWPLLNEIIQKGTDPVVEMLLTRFIIFFTSKSQHVLLNFEAIADANMTSEVLKDIVHHGILESLMIILNNASLSKLASELLFILYDYAHCILTDINLDFVANIFKSATCFQTPHVQDHNYLKTLELKQLYPLHCQQLFVIDNSLKQFKINKLFYSQINDTHASSFIVKGYANNVTNILKSFNDAMCHNATTFDKSDNWSFELILQSLLQLENEPLLLDFINSKYYKRLLSYFTINTKEFTLLPKDCSKSIINTFYTLFKILLNHECGYKSLLNSDFMQQFIFAFKQLVPSYNNNLPSDLLFSNQNISDTAIFHYIPLIEVFTTQSFGLKLLVNNHFYSIVLQIIDHASNHLFLMQFINYFNFYHLHAKGILTKLVTSSYELIRLTALQHCTVIPDDYKVFVLHLLIEQLNDPNLTIVVKCTDLLLLMLKSTKYIDIFINYKPNLNSIRINKQLLYTCLTTAVGFEYLESFLNDELRVFVTVMNTKYMINYDAYRTSKLLNMHHNTVDAFKQCKFDKEIKLEINNLEMPHLFYYICQTKEGYAYLSCSSEFEQMVQYLSSQHYNKHSSYKTTTIINGILVAFGYLGMSVHGLECLEDYNLINVITNLAQNSHCISIRATCFHCLTMIGTHPKGQERLKQFKWNCQVVQHKYTRIISGPVPSDAAFYKVIS